MVLGFKNKLTYNSLIYIVSSFLSKGIGFLLLPILTRVLSPADYGHIAMFTLWIAILQPIISLNTPAAAERFYYDTNRKGMAEYIGVIILLSLLMTFVCVGCVLLFDSYLEKYLSLSLDWLIIGLISTLFVNLFILYYRLLIVKERAVFYGILQNSFSFTEIIISLFLIFWLGLGWQGRTGGMVFSRVIFGLIAFTLFFREHLIKISFNKKKVSELILFGAPLILHALSGILSTSMDKFFLNNMISTSVVGLYNVADKYSMIIGTIANSIQLAFVPYAYSRIKEGKSERVWKIGTIIVVADLGVFLVLLLLQGVFFNIIVGESFTASMKYFVYLGLAQALGGVYYLGAVFNFWYKKTFYIALVTISRLIANIILNYYLIIKMGDLGAAVATLISTALGALMSVTLGVWFNRRSS